MYIMNCTRPDIAYSIGKLSRFIRNTSMDHWDEIKMVLRYLRHIMNYELYYTIYLMILDGYNDVNWISDTKNLKSMSGYASILGGATISWKSFKQSCITKSMMK
jgi:hypothetical protein